MAKKEVTEELVAIYANAAALFIEVDEHDKAWLELSDLLEEHGENSIIYYYLGSLCAKIGRLHQSVLFLRKALEFREDFPGALSNLSAAYRRLGEQDKALTCIEKAIDFEPENASLWANVSGCHVAMGRPQKCIQAADKALSIDHENVYAKNNKGLAQLEMGDYLHGFQNYEFREVFAPLDFTGIREGRNYEIDGKTPFWDGTKGKTVVLIGEQGIGDEIMFASIIPELMQDANVIFDAHPRLADIFRNTFPKLPILGTRKQNDLAKMPWIDIFDIEAKINIGSLPKMYRKKKEDFPGTPYLKPDDRLLSNMITFINENIPPGILIGFSWKGGVAKTNEAQRRCPLEEWLPLFNMNAQWVSLQYHKDAEDELNNFLSKHKHLKSKIHHFNDILADYDQTHALICNLELIISVPQSIVHLAGATGIFTWQLCPKRGMWQMGVYGENAPWYNCVENIWQQKDGDWKTVINKTKEKLCPLLAKATEISTKNSIA